MGTDKSIEFYGADWCSDCRRAQKVLNSLNIPFTYHDLVADPAAAAQAYAISGQKHIPVIQFPDGTFLVEPSNAELAAKAREL